MNMEGLQAQTGYVSTGLNRDRKIKSGDFFNDGDYRLIPDHIRLSDAKRASASAGSVDKPKKHYRKYIFKIFDKATGEVIEVDSQEKVDLACGVLSGYYGRSLSGHNDGSKLKGFDIRRVRVQ